MLAIRHTNLSHRTCNGYTRASETDEQHEVRKKVERNDGIKIKNIEMLRLTPTELHSITMWKSITVHSKSLLLDQ